MKIWQDMDLVELGEEYLRLQDDAELAEIKADNCAQFLIERLKDSNCIGVQLRGIRLVRTKHDLLETKET